MEDDNFKKYQLLHICECIHIISIIYDAQV